MAKTQYLEYTIHLIDKAQATSLAAANPAGIRIAPDTAATTYAAPMQLVSAPFVAPCTRSPFFIFAGAPNFPRTVAQFSRKSGGWFGLPILFGTTTIYIWVGKFVYGAGTLAEINGVPREIVAIAKRKWLIGFDDANAGGDHAEMGSVSGTANHTSRQASRHGDGFGFFSSANGEYVAYTNQSGDALTNKTWERFYFRMTTAPSATQRMHRMKFSVGANRGCSLNMTLDRRLVVHNHNDAGVETSLATSTQQFALDTWYRVDLLVEVKAGGNLRVYINRKLEITATGTGGVGLDSVSTHDSSYIGPGASAAATNQFVCHYDDWVGAAWPTPDSGGVFVGLDWLNGSRVRMIPASAFGTGNNFVGDYRYANQYPNVLAADGAALLTTSVSGDALRLLVDEKQITAAPGAIGVVAFLVATNGLQSVAGQGTLGWKYNGVIDLAAHTGETAANIWSRRWFLPAGLTVPIANLTPFELHKVKALNANPASIRAAVLSVELIGVFGAEDVGDDETNQPTPLAPPIGMHNAPYMTTPWARSTLPQIAPVIIHSGTYAGNGTAQELLFRAPVGWLMIMDLGGATFATAGAASIGGLWWSSMVGGHDEGLRGVSAGFPVEARIDPSFVAVEAEDNQEQRTVIRIVGADTQFNTSGRTYQYIAFSDPGMRYHVNHAYQLPTAVWTPVGSKSVPLPHATFLPEFGFFHQETPGNTAGAYGRWLKGPGHATDAASKMDAVESVTAVRHLAGSVTVLSALFGPDATVITPFSVWRDDDNSADPNKHGVVKIGTYTGDGTASRTINFATTGTKRPLYVIVQGHNGVAYHRTPAHTTVYSTAMSATGVVTTGITAGGIDSFSVGTTLNANGIVYEYFVLIGSATAGNAGWSIDGEFAVVEPDSATDGPGAVCADPLANNFGVAGPCTYTAAAPTTCTDPLATNYGGALPCVYTTAAPPGGECVGATESTCITETTALINSALFEIGVNRLLTNYCTQLDREAVVARTLFNQVVRTVLHAYPWPFATKYATLALATSQPTHADWTYAYRVPTDCVFPRRLVASRGTGVDPEPPAFMLSSEAAGGLLFTNQASAVLEYTSRPTCVAVLGDALFVETLKWKLGAVLAPPLTRMDEPAARCQAEYVKCLEMANAIRKPGVPGVRTAAALVGDEATACVAANLQVVNRGLLRIGCQTIASLTTDQSRPAVAANLILEDEIRATLRDYPWKFAKRYNDALGTAVVGTTALAANPDWQYGYRLPTDTVMVRRLVAEGTGRSFEESPPPWEVGTDATGDLLFTSELDPNLEYTARINCVVQKGDDLFRDALAWRLAAALAPSLAQVDPSHPEQVGRGPDAPPDPRQRISHKPNQAAMRAQAVRYAQAMYQAVLTRARIADANEAEPEDNPDAEWIRGR